MIRLSSFDILLALPFYFFLGFFSLIFYRVGLNIINDSLFKIRLNIKRRVGSDKQCNKYNYGINLLLCCFIIISSLIYTILTYALADGIFKGIFFIVFVIGLLFSGVFSKPINILSDLVSSCLCKAVSLIILIVKKISIILNRIKGILLTKYKRIRNTVWRKNG